MILIINKSNKSEITDLIDTFNFGNKLFDESWTDQILYTNQGY